MDTVASLWLWATFGVIVLVSLFIDFVVLKKTRGGRYRCEGSVELVHRMDSDELFI